MALSTGDTIWLQYSKLHCLNAGGWVGDKMIEKVLDGVIPEVIIEELESEIIRLLQVRLEALMAIRNISVNYIS